MSGAALAGLERWPVPTVAAAVVTADGTLVETQGPQRHRFRLASIAKLLTSYAVMVAVEEEALALDDLVDGLSVIAALQAAHPEDRRLTAIPTGTTVRHLLAHTSGLGFNGTDPAMSRPGERRTYSNAGIEAAAEHLTQVTGVPFEEYLTEAVLDPLDMADTLLDGSPAHGLYSTAADVVAFVRELFDPRLLDPVTLAEMVAVAFPGVDGVIPGVGSFRPCDWGLGFERNFGRTGHWAGTTPSRATFGHFGGAGTMLWVDPRAGVATVCLTDRPFDAWALQVWPPLSTAVIQTHAQPHGRV